MGDHAAFNFRGKKFVYFLNSHHGDGIVSLQWRCELTLAQSLLESETHRFFPPAYLANRGWLAVRLDLGDLDWTELSDFIHDSYRAVAPKRLLATLDQ